MAFKHLTDHEIQKFTFQMKTLDQNQREIVRDLLNRLQSGGIGELELKKELQKLRQERQISEIDRRAIEEAIFSTP